jgi:hypothetical protein
MAKRAHTCEEDLASAVGHEAEVFAEAEGADTLLEGSATAMEEALKKGFETEGTGDAVLDLREFSGGEFFPARADGSIVAEAAEEKSDFGEGEAHFAGEADEQHTIQSVGGIAALAAKTLGRREEARLFVVADGRGVDAGATREFADFHVCPQTLPKCCLT